MYIVFYFNIYAYYCIETYRNNGRNKLLLFTPSPLHISLSIYLSFKQINIYEKHNY